MFFYLANAPPNNGRNNTAAPANENSTTPIDATIKTPSAPANTVFTLKLLLLAIAVISSRSPRNVGSPA